MTLDGSFHLIFFLPTHVALLKITVQLKNFTVFTSRQLTDNNNGIMQRHDFYVYMNSGCCNCGLCFVSLALGSPPTLPSPVKITFKYMVKENVQIFVPGHSTETVAENKKHDSSPLPGHAENKI
jgi:hypothetical protein